MKKYYVICTTLLSLSLISCIGNSGGASNSNGGVISQPGNLISDTSSIAKSGSSTIRISNVGQLPVVINSGAMDDNQTKDDIDDSHTDCYGKTLNQNQSCSMTIEVYPGEAGISKVELNTSNGVYEINLNVDTSGEGVIDTDLKSLQTTKEQTVNVVNKGAMPVTLTKFNLEQGNKTLTVADSNCLGKTLDSGQSCQLKAKASAGQNRHHILYMSTSNRFMTTQQVPLYEKTDINSLNLTTESGDVNPISESSPGVKYWTISNSGSNDIHISNVKLGNTNIGSISNNTCDGKVLQAGDNCGIAVSVNQNAYGSDKSAINTDEPLTKGAEYAININSDNLTVDNGSNDVIMHTNTNKTVDIKNTSNFDINVDNIQFNNQELNVDSTCKNILKPNDKCTVSIKALNTQNDNSSFTFNEFSGGFTKKINVHINNGVSIVSENPGSSFYNVLPQDNNFYQIFTINNPTNTPINLDTMIRNSSVSKVQSNSMPNYVWILPSCIDNGNVAIANIPANSTCELILKEPKDYNALKDLVNDQSNPDKGNFRLTVNYVTGDMFLQKFQGNVISHNVHRDQTYPNGTIISNQTTTIQGQCCLRQGCSPVGYTYNIKLYSDLIDSNTVDGVFSISTMCIVEPNRANKIRVSLLNYSNDTYFSNIDSVPIYMQSGSNCLNDQCELMFNTNFKDVSWNANFKKPLPAADWLVADRVVWQSLGSVTLANSKKNQKI